jgi:hypothetical protein
MKGAIKLRLFLCHLVIQLVNTNWLTVQIFKMFYADAIRKCLNKMKLDLDNNESPIAINPNTIFKHQTFKTSD